MKHEKDEIETLRNTETHLLMATAASAPEVSFAGDAIVLEGFLIVDLALGGLVVFGVQRLVFQLFQILHRLAC